MGWPTITVMGRKRCKQKARIFNALRVEEWQLNLRAGDCFLVLVQPGVAIWGVAEAQAHDDAWHATLYSAVSPEGIQDVIKVTQMDLPVTERQFAAARRMDWPCEIDAVRAIVSMTTVGAA
jgi:hypothetical protein